MGTGCQMGADCAKGVFLLDYARMGANVVFLSSQGTLFHSSQVALGCVVEGGATVGLWPANRFLRAVRCGSRAVSSVVLRRLVW